MKEVQSISIADLSFTSDRFDQGDISALAENIKTYGLQQPLVVAKNEKGYVIVDGRRRFVACQQIGMAEVTCVILEGDEVNEDLSLILNTYRLNLSPVELYHQAVRYVKDELKGDPMMLSPDKLKMVATKLNLDIYTTCRVLNIGRLHESVRELLINKKIPLRLALLTIKLEKESTRVQFCRMCEKERPSTKEAIDWIRWRVDDENGRPWRILDNAIFNTDSCRRCRHRGRRDPSLFEDPGRPQEDDADYCWDKKCYGDKTVRAWEEQLEAACKKHGLSRIKRADSDTNKYSWHEFPRLIRKDPAKCKTCEQARLMHDYFDTFTVMCPPTCSNIAAVKGQDSRRSKEKRYRGKDPDKFSREDKIAYLNDRFPVAIRKVMLEHFFTGKVFKEEKVPKDHVRILFFVGCDALSNPFGAVSHAKDWGNRTEKILATKALTDLDLHAVAQLNVTAAANRLRSYDRAGVNAQEIDQAIELLYGTKNWCVSHYEAITANLSNRSKKYLNELKSWRPAWARSNKGKKHATG